MWCTTREHVAVRILAYCLMPNHWHLLDQVLLTWFSGTPPYTVSPLQGIRNALGAQVDVQFVADDADEAVRRARAADAAIVVVGNHPTCNAGWNRCPDPSEGKEAIDRKSLDLGPEDMIRKVRSANPRTIVVLIEASRMPSTGPRRMSRPSCS